MIKQDIFNQKRLEISCDLAGDLVDEFFHFDQKETYIEEVKGEFIYTDKAQEKFNEFQELIEQAMISFAKSMIRNKVGLKTLNYE